MLEGLNEFRYYKNNTSFPSYAQKNGHLVITTQHFQLCFSPKFGCTFLLQPRAKQKFGENNGVTYQRHPVYQKALSGPRASPKQASCLVRVAPKTQAKIKNLKISTDSFLQVRAQKRFGFNYTLDL